MRKLLLLLTIMLALSTVVEGQFRLKRSAIPKVSQIVTLTITSTDATLVQGVEGVEYPGVTLTATGGTAPYTWSNNDAGDSLNDSDSECEGMTLTDGVVGGTPVNAGTCTFTIVVTDSEMATASQTFNLIIVAPETVSVPDPWQFTDLGTVNPTGTAIEDMDEFALGCSGRNIGGSPDSKVDAGCLVYQPITGDYELIAEVTTPSPGGKAGVMLRNSLNIDAANIFAFVSTSGACSMQVRTTDGGTTTSATGQTSGYNFVRVTRVNDTFVAYCSTDGDEWAVAGTAQTISMGDTIYAALALSRASAIQELATSTFTNVEVNEITSETPPVEEDFGCYRPYWQGPGCDMEGGRGVSGQNQIHHVTTLARSGTGSLPAILAAINSQCSANPGKGHFIVFDVGGISDWQGLKVDILCPYITIAGQTAPSPGYTIKRGQIYVNPLDATFAHNIVFQHIRMLGGASVYPDMMWLRTRDTVGIAFDHVTMCWTTDETIGAQGGQIFMADSLFCEALHHASAGSDSKSILLNNGDNAQLTGVRNLLAHNVMRNPWVAIGARLTWINNIVYNDWGSVDSYNPVTNVRTHGNGRNRAHISIMAGTATAYYIKTAPPVEAVIMHNLRIPGPDTTPNRPCIAMRSVPPGSQIHLANNEGCDTFTGLTGNGQWAAVDYEKSLNSAAAVREDTLSNIAYWAPYSNFHILPIAGNVLRDCIVANVGFRPKTDRHANIETRVINDMLNGTGSFIEHENEVGGFPTISPTSDAWEEPADPFDDDDGDGRLNIEETLETQARALEDWAACGF